MHYMIPLRSRLRRDLLTYFFTNHHARHYVRELSRLLAVDPTNLSRELGNLERQGLFHSESRGNQKYFSLDRDYPLYEEVRQIIFKTVGVVGQLRTTFQNIKGLEQAYLYGSFARNQEDAQSDIDVLLVGKPEAEKLEDAVRKLEKRLHREINHTILSSQEFRKRRADKDAFLEDIWHQKRIRLMGSL